MANDINPAVIKLTQETLGKYVKKPSLSDKLLRKPPFRFLHDVFGVVIRETGCFGGLYTDEELNSENIKDRDDKMRFLQKMIDVVRICTNVPITVKTSKIVAGHEAEKTNELLQLMGKIIEGNLNWQLAVEQVLKGKDTKIVSDKAEESTANKKDAKVKDTKVNKNASKLKQPTTISKEDKAKRTKAATKQKSPDPVEKPLKSNKIAEKSTKKSKESTKAKLAKSDSQTSHTSSLSPNKEDKKLAKERKVLKKEVDCNHEEMEVSKENAPIKSLVLESVQSNAVVDNLHKPIDSAVARKTTNSVIETSDARGAVEDMPTPVLSDPVVSNSRKSSPPQELSKLSDNTRIEYESIRISSDKSSDNSTLDSSNNIQNSNDKKDVTESPTIKKENKQLHKVEVKRESTFTREDTSENRQNQANDKPSRPRTSLRPPSARPPSARPGAPRRRDRNVEIILQPHDQVKMSGIQVKLETFGDLEDDGENLVIIESGNADGMSTEDVMVGGVKTEGQEMNAVEQGHLVQQILETQKELTHQKDINQQIKYEKDSVNGGLAIKQTSTHHMNNLREVIQNLTKSVNPLGKLLDFIPEDIDAMQLEFSMWRDTYTQAANQLKREKSLTDSATEPMKNQLVQIESNILEYMEMIDASRRRVQRVLRGRYAQLEVFHTF